MAKNSITSQLTGGLINTDAVPYGKIALGSEKKRQGLINLGLDQINSIFQGGTSPFYSFADPTKGTFDRTKTYYALSSKKGGGFVPYWAPKGKKPKGTPFDPGYGPILMGQDPGSSALMGNLVGGSGTSSNFLTQAITPNIFGPVGSVTAGLFGGLFGKKGKSPRQLAKAAFKKGKLFEAPEYESFEGFQDPFFEKRAQDYVDFALPQLADQYRTNQRGILYGLSNRGLDQSTVADEAVSNLERVAGEGRQQIAESGLAQANQLRKDVEGARQEAIRQLYQSADPAQATQSAIRSAAGFQSPSVFAPIANMFTNIANQYMTSRLLNNYQTPYGVDDNDIEANNFAPI